MEEKDSYSQKNNIVGRDQAGRDINKNYFGVSENQKSAMGTLIKKFCQEKETNQMFNDTIDKINHYKTNVDNGNPVGLEVKLTDGNRKNYIEFAQISKESFAKKMVKYQFYRSAQEILAFLLAEVHQRYYNLIYPQIVDGISEEIINELIQHKIIAHIQNILEDNVLEIFSDEINGMLYFLTGNCHIKWV